MTSPSGVLAAPDLRCRDCCCLWPIINPNSPQASGGQFRVGSVGTPSVVGGPRTVKLYVSVGFMAMRGVNVGELIRDNLYDGFPVGRYLMGTCKPGTHNYDELDITKEDVARCGRPTMVTPNSSFIAASHRAAMQDLTSVPHHRAYNTALSDRLNAGAVKRAAPPGVPGLTSELARVQLSGTEPRYVVWGGGGGESEANTL